MNCVNCGCRLTFFNETDELWSGTERVFCVSCRKRITPFLEEKVEGGNLTHLHERKAALIARGVTPEGYAHLSEYCKYLDSLLAPRRSLIPDALPPEPIPEDPAGSDADPRAREGGVDSADVRAALDAQRRANERIEGAIENVSTELVDGTQLIGNRMEKIQEKIRLLIYLASIGAVGGVLAFLIALLVLINR